MIIQCPNCQTKYRIDASKVRPGQSKVRCSRCKHEFVAVEQEEGREAAEVARAEPGGEAEGEGSEGGLFDEFEDSASEGLPGGREKRSKFARILLWIIILLIFAAAGTAGTILFPQIRALVPFLQAPEEQQAGLSQKSPLEEGSIEDIALLDVRQYMVQNEKVGRILVIEGKAVNKSEVPKKLIKLRATLYDEQGQPLRDKEFLCGNTVSLFQLQVLSRSELESALHSKVGVLTNNSNLGSGQEVEFMAVFFKPEQGLTEFSLQVTKALNVEGGT